MSNGNDEFYIGYLLQAPAGVHRFVRRWIALLFLITTALALLLVYGQQPFAPSEFEYGNVKTFTGVVAERPYPTLVVDGVAHLLAAPGKHGAAEMVKGFEGRSVTLQGQLIFRPEQRMIEIVPGTLRAGSDAAPPAADRKLGQVTLTGEIVDSKCWTGVMNPGHDKVHRDCAALCIAGGLPPLLVSATRTGSPEVFQLAGVDGRPLSRELLPFVAEPVTVRGSLQQRGGVLLLSIDPRILQHKD